MRVVAIAAIASLALSSAASAVTTITGTVSADPGDVTSTGPIDIPGIGSGQARTFTFDWSGGTLVDAELAHQVSFVYSFYDSSLDPPILSSNSQTLIGDCFFTGASASCNGPLVGGSVSAGRITGSIRTLPGFDLCASTPPPAPGDPVENCFESYDTISAVFEARFDGSSDVDYRLVIGDAGVVPEPATWALMIGGFGLVGGAIRRKRTVAALA